MPLDRQADPAIFAGNDRAIGVRRRCDGHFVIRVDVIDVRSAVGHVHPAARRVDQPAGVHVLGDAAYRLGVILTPRSEEHTSELQSLMRISYAVFCLQNKTTNDTLTT